MTMRPIGVIDSGVGGLTVWQELATIMPDENYLYFGDSGFCPYGSKDVRDITRRVTKIVDFLIANRCKIVVVACNAITAAAIAFLRSRYPLPFVGMEPAIKPALKKTRTNVIGVLATERTLKGDLFSRTKAAYGRGVEVVEQVGHGLVEKVESLDFDSQSTMAVLRSHIQPMLARNIDVLVLGCTHYPFLQASIKRILGDRIAILNPAPAVAQHTANTLERLRLRRVGHKPPTTSVFYTTGNRDPIERLLAILEADRYDVKSIAI
jgi:glutamate racemase